MSNSYVWISMHVLWMPRIYEFSANTNYFNFIVLFILMSVINFIFLTVSLCLYTFLLHIIFLKWSVRLKFELSIFLFRFFIFITFYLTRTFLYYLCYSQDIETVSQPYPNLKRQPHPRLNSSLIRCYSQLLKIYLCFKTVVH